MAYREPTEAEWLIVVAALVGPLVYAFKHHGRARMVALIVWLPMLLFVTRLAFYRPVTHPTWDFQWAATAFYDDPLTIAWPAFVLGVYGLRRLVRRSRSKSSGPVATAPGDYGGYLQSAAWQQRRREAIQLAGGRCQVCNSSGALEVHHRTYERVGREVPGDLTVLCRECHARFHEGGRMPVRR
jgi:hypothetical protein